MDRLTCLSVEDIEVTVLARLGDRFDPTPTNVHVEQDRRTARVVIPDVVVRLLKVPCELAGAERERDDRVGEKILPGSLPGVAERIADRDVKQSQLGIDRRCLPDAAAVALATYPRRSGDLPTLILLVLRNRVEMPEHLARLRVDSEHVAARDVALAPRAADIEHAV